MPTSLPSDTTGSFTLSEKAGLLVIALMGCISGVLVVVLLGIIIVRIVIVVDMIYNSMYDRFSRYRRTSVGGIATFDIIHRCISSSYLCWYQI